MKILFPNNTILNLKLQHIMLMYPTVFRNYYSNIVILDKILDVKAYVFYSCGLGKWTCDRSSLGYEN